MAKQREINVIDAPLQQAIWAEMQRAGVKAKPLARAAGLSDTYILHLLKGRFENPTLPKLHAIAAALGLDPNHFLTLDNEPAQPAPAKSPAITIRAESRPDGSLLIEIPGGTHLAQSEAVALLQLYGAAPNEARRAAMLRLRHPDLQQPAAQPPAQAGEKSQAERDQLFLAGVKAALIPLGFAPDTPEWFSAIATAFELRARECGGQPLAAATSQAQGRANPGTERRRQPA